MTAGIGTYDSQISVRTSELPTGVREETVGRSRNVSFNLQPTYIVTLTRAADPPTDHCSSHLESWRNSHCARHADTCNSSDVVVKDAEDDLLTDV